jgi:hypothetical protein
VKTRLPILGLPPGFVGGSIGGEGGILMSRLRPWLLASAARPGATGFTYNHVRGYHPLLAVAAGTGDALHARLRQGSANTVRGAARFLRETIGRVRAAGATGELTVRADSGFYSHDLITACRDQHPDPLRVAGGPLLRLDEPSGLRRQLDPAV